MTEKAGDIKSPPPRMPSVTKNKCPTENKHPTDAYACSHPGYSLDIQYPSRIFHVFFFGAVSFSQLVRGLLFQNSLDTALKHCRGDSVPV